MNQSGKVPTLSSSEIMCHFPDDFKVPSLAKINLQ